MVLGFAPRALCLLKRCSTAWSMTPALFALVILEIGSHFFCEGCMGHHPPILCVMLLLGWQEHAIRPTFFLLRLNLTNFFAEVGLELQFSLPQLPQWLWFQVWTTGTMLIVRFCPLGPGSSSSINVMLSQMTGHNRWAHFWAKHGALPMAM
jgi:hypothetical protein